MDDAELLRTVLAAVTRRIVKNNVRVGFRGDPASEVTFLGAMALLHSEVSEAVEAWREYGVADATQPPPGITRASLTPLSKPEGVGSEFADVFIRLLDNCDLFGVDLASEVMRKLSYNETRPYRHGGKRS